MCDLFFSTLMISTALWVVLVLYDAERTTSRWWWRVHGSQTQLTVSPCCYVQLGSNYALRLGFVYHLVPFLWKFSYHGAGMKYCSSQICDFLPGQKLEWHLLQRASLKAFVELVNWWLRLVVRCPCFVNLIFLSCSLVLILFLVNILFRHYCSLLIHKMWLLYDGLISILIVFLSSCRRLKEAQAHLWLLVGTFSSFSSCLHWLWFFYLSNSTLFLCLYCIIMFLLVYVKLIWWQRKDV